MQNGGMIQYLRGSGKGIELIYCKNSCISYPVHNHTSVVTVGIVLEGSVRVTIGCKTENYCKNRVFAILPYTPHRIEAKGNYTLLSICIQKNRLQKCGSEVIAVERNVEKDLLEWLEASADVYGISLGQIMCLLHGMDSLHDLTLGQRMPDRFYIDKILMRLEQFPEDKLSLDEMAALLYVSKYHFIRSFKQAVGLTPHQFQIQKRVRKAQRLLERSEDTAEVALSAGFYDQSHFIRQFYLVVNAESGAGNYFMCFCLFCMYVVPDFFVWSDAYQVITELSSGLCGCKDVL